MSAQQLEERRDTLRSRLNDGYQRIEEAAAAGADIASWEAYWLSLLHDYEACCRQLDEVNAISPAAIPVDTPWTTKHPMDEVKHTDQLTLGAT